MSGQGTTGSPGVSVRRFSSTETPSIRALLSHCSPDTLRARFSSTSDAAALSYLDSITSADNQLTVAAWSGMSMVGVASAFWESTSAELAVLVRDDWQCRGIGFALTLWLYAAAASRGIGVVRAQIDVTNVRARALLMRICPREARFSSPSAGLIDVEFPVGLGCPRRASAPVPGPGASHRSVIYLPPDLASDLGVERPVVPAQHFGIDSSRA